MPGPLFPENTTFHHWNTFWKCRHLRCSKWWYVDWTGILRPNCLCRETWRACGSCSLDNTSIIGLSKIAAPICIPIFFWRSLEVSKHPACRWVLFDGLGRNGCLGEVELRFTHFRKRVSMNKVSFFMTWKMSIHGWLQMSSGYINVRLSSAQVDPKIFTGCSFPSLAELLAWGSRRISPPNRSFLHVHERGRERDDFVKSDFCCTSHKFKNCLGIYFCFWSTWQTEQKKVSKLHS